MNTINSLHYIIFIDSCAFYPPQPDEKMAIEELFHLDGKGIIDLVIAEATDEEMRKAPQKLRDRVNSRINALDKIGTQEERIRLVEIQKLLFLHKKILNEGEKRDVRNIFCAQKHGCDIFVTVDRKDILNKEYLIKQKLGMQVVTPTQCLKVVLDRIEWNKKHEEEMRKLKGE